jgi:mRNA interferase MazF
MAEYVPRKGDFIALTFDPQSGHEQRGRRPGFVMVEQVKSVDFRARKAKHIEQAPRQVLEESLSLLDACVY